MAPLFQVTDYTPPSSPTKRADPMAIARLERTPTSPLPLTPSPTKPLSTSISPAKPQDGPQSNITKALRTLHRTTSAFALRPQASAASLRGPGSLSPTGAREVVGRWPFSRATTGTSAGSEVGDHFERAPPVQTVDLRRRRVEARQRVGRMRGWLSGSEGDVNGDVKGAVKGGEWERVRIRVDSGTYEGVEGDGAATADVSYTPGLSATTPPPTPPTATETHKHNADPNLPPLHEDTLFLSLHGPYPHPHTRTHTHAPRLCTYCNTPGAAWTLHGCGHGVHARCVGLLGDRQSRENKDGGCGRCEGLGRWVRRWGFEGVRARVERLRGLEGGC